MVAKTIAAARLEQAKVRQARGVGADFNALELARIRTALLAEDSGHHALPDAATFQPLLPMGLDVPLSGSAANVFSSHTTYQVPCEGTREFDSIHRFCVAAGSAGAMNDGIRKLALRQESRARSSGDSPDARNDGVLPLPRDQSAAGVLASNEGGYQSYPDLFDYSESLEHLRTGAPHGGPEPASETNEWNVASASDTHGRHCCHELLRVTSLAMDQIEGAQNSVADAAARPEAASLHAANAWLNVNRGGDENIMHVHRHDRWSATYYVAASPSSPHKLDGCMLLRAGAKQRPGQAPLTSHTFMTVAPVPGTLWLFPGSVPHRVLGMTGSPGVDLTASDERSQWGPRISVAINFLDAMPKSTRQQVGRTASSE